MSYNILTPLSLLPTLDIPGQSKGESDYIIYNITLLSLPPALDILG